MAYELTFADWLYSRPDRKGLFMPYTENMGTSMPVAEYLRVPPAERKGKVPVIMRIDAQERWVKHAVSRSAIEETESAYRAWRLLRELAGEIAEFPEKIYARATKEASDKFEKEKNDLQSAHDQRIRQLETEYMEKLRARLKARLMGLSGSN
jgi:pyruvate-ferredoxin/flavodoxin oxidoreductase